MNAGMLHLHDAKRWQSANAPAVARAPAPAAGRKPATKRAQAHR
jgi:hypothetical protein